LGFDGDEGPGGAAPTRSWPGVRAHRRTGRRGRTGAPRPQPAGHAAHRLRGRRSRSSRRWGVGLITCFRMAQIWEKQRQRQRSADRWSGRAEDGRLLDHRPSPVVDQAIFRSL